LPTSIDAESIHLISKLQIGFEIIHLISKLQIGFEVIHLISKLQIGFEVIHLVVISTRWSCSPLFSYTTVNTEDFVYASQSLEISSTTSFKTTFLAQLMHGETRNKSKLKSIQAYNNRLGYLPAQTFR
jgi:hypothetical protein